LRKLLPEVQAGAEDGENSGQARRDFLTRLHKLAR
jgi:hypothetical protein